MTKFQGIAARRYERQYQAYRNLPELPIAEIEILADDIVSAWSREQVRLIQGLVERICDDLAKENVLPHISITTVRDNLQSMLLQMMNVKAEFRNGFAGKERVPFSDYSLLLKEKIDGWHKITSDCFFHLELISGHEPILRIVLYMISQLSGDFAATENAIDSPEWV